MQRPISAACRAAIATLASCCAPLLAGTGWTPLVTDGFGDPSIFAYYGPVRASSGLYVGAIPFMGAARLFHSQDGTSWQESVTPGFGDANNISITPSLEFGGELYAGTTNSATGGQLWKTTDGSSWVQVSGPGAVDLVGLHPTTTFGGELVLLSNSWTGGASVWSSPDGNVWTEVSARGFGNPQNQGLLSAVELNGELYVGTLNSATGAELWRTADGTTWSQVTGVGGPTTISAGPSAVFQGHLYVVLQDFMGAVVVQRSADGATWESVAAPGVGDPDTFGMFILPQTYRGRMVAGTQGLHGGAIWSTANGLDWERECEDGLGIPSNGGVLPSFAFGDELYVHTMANGPGSPQLWVLDPVQQGVSFCGLSPNSAGPGASLMAEGDASLQAECLSLRVEGCPPDVPGVFFVGTGQVASPLGDGTLCAGGSIARVAPTVQTDALGMARLTLDYDAFFGGLVTPGGSGINYQFWYADPTGGPAGVNLSDAVHVVHAP